jgi:hypothetical protein
MMENDPENNFYLKNEKVYCFPVLGKIAERFSSYFSSNKCFDLSFNPFMEVFVVRPSVRLSVWPSIYPSVALKSRIMA